MYLSKKCKASEGPHIRTFKSLPTAEEMLERQLEKGRVLADFAVERLASRISQQEGLEIDGVRRD